MGLDIDCGDVELFHGSYSTFHHFRQAVATCLGYGALYDEGETPARTAKNAEAREKEPVLLALITHSDCEGYWSVRECRDMVGLLERVIPLMENAGGPVSPVVTRDESGGGLRVQMFDTGITWRDIANKMLAGLRHCVERRHRASFG